MLVVDDDRLLRWAIAETLGARGYEVREAGDAATAARVLTAAPGNTDLVLLDLFLPDSHDLHVLAMMRELRPDMPVVLMTAYGTSDLAEKATAMGALVANKPFDMSELAAVVDRALLIRLH